jgi:hypothetical protein
VTASASSRQIQDFAVFDGAQRLPNAQLNIIRDKSRGPVGESDLDASRMPAPRGSRMVGAAAVSGSAGQIHMRKIQLSGTP